MTLTNLGRLTTVLVCFAAAANAGLIGGGSSYGENFSSTPAPCTSLTTTSFSSFTFSCDTDGATITAEAFTASVPALNGDTLEMFDFKVTDAPSDYTLTLTATGAPINSANDLGLFTCAGVTDTPQCSNDLPMGVTSTSNYGSLESSFVASFPVTGATSGDTFVFFVALDDPNGTGASVNASLASTSSTATPEPGFFLLSGLCLLAFGLLGRKAAPIVKGPSNPR